MKRKSASVAVAALFAFSIATGSPVRAAVCSLQGTDLTIETGDDVVVGRSGDAITANEQPCTDATVTNVDHIFLTDTASDGGAEITISLRNGPFGPGKTAEAEGISEIEISLFLRNGEDLEDTPSLTIEGTEGADSITVGTAGVGLNTDDDVDVPITSLHSTMFVGLDLLGGDDVASGQGGHGAGQPREASVGFSGGDGNDTLTGSAGGDTMAGGPGADQIDGGSDIGEMPWDAVDYGASPAAVNVDLGAGTVSGGDGEGDTLTGIDSIFSSGFDDVLAGDDFPNFFGDYDGNDSMSGGGSNDIFQGGPGRDTLDGGDGADRIEYDKSEVGVNVDLGTGVGTGGYAEGDVLTGLENLSGSFFDDHLIGDDDNNFLRGFEGNDIIEGREGADYIGGDEGNDELRGEGGNDYFSEGNNGEGTDVIDGGDGSDFADYDGKGVPVTLSSDGIADDGAEGENDNLISIEKIGACSSNDRVKGSPNPDTLNGNGGNDRLSGNAGDDRLIGGEGNDILKGGAGKDTCVIGKGGGDKTTGCETVIKRNNM